MAKRNDMSAARRSRNREQEPVTQSCNTDTTKIIGDPVPESLPRGNADAAGVISTERDRLMKAQAVLECVAFTLLYEDWLPKPHRPSYADAVTVVRDLVNESVARLEGG